MGILFRFLQVIFEKKILKSVSWGDISIFSCIVMLLSHSFKLLIVICFYNNMVLCDAEMNLFVGCKMKWESNILNFLKIWFLLLMLRKIMNFF